MTSAERDALAYGVDIDGEWLAYGYGLYRDDGYRIFLDRIKAEDDEDSIEDWARHIREEYGENAAEAFEDFASRILCDPRPSAPEISASASETLRRWSRSRRISPEPPPNSNSGRDIP